jgi:hypothetical protein
MTSAKEATKSTAQLMALEAVSMKGRTPSSHRRETNGWRHGV